VNHVALLIPGIDKIGGAERQAITLAQGLTQRGWRASMVALSGSGGTASQELLSARVDFVSLHMRKGIADPLGWAAFTQWIRSECPDVLHAHLPHATWMARGARLLAPVRVVVDTVHTSATGRAARRLGYGATAWLSDRVTMVSHAAADAFVRAGMVRRERVSLLPNGVDVQRWRPDSATRSAVRRELGAKDEFVWFTAGRLEHVKDYPTMILAFMGLAESARLVIAGDGSQESRLRKLVQALEIEDRVLFLGFQPDVRPWVQAADGFVLSSLWEGLPVSLLEAAACEIPCVATNVAGTREVVLDGETGFLASAESPASLRRAMMRLMHMAPEARRSMGRVARERVTELFSLEGVLDRWEALYRRLLQENSSPRRLAGRRPAVAVLPRFADGESVGVGTGAPLP
jgi:glycosyltransferase involved in cell wall biosynthesis